MLTAGSYHFDQPVRGRFSSSRRLSSSVTNNAACRRALVVLPALVALSCLVIYPTGGAYPELSRGMLVATNLGLCAWAWLSNDVQIRSSLLRLGTCGAAAASLWLGVLQVWLAHSPVLARGVLGVVAGSLTHAAILAFITTPPGTSNKASTANHLVLAASAALLTLFGIETALQATRPVNFYEVIPETPGGGSYLIPQAGVRWALSPGFRGRYMHPEFPGLRVEINRLGFRVGLDESAPPASGEASILVLGDSLVFGTGVELDETFHRVLEQRARDMTTRTLRVYGAGVPGYGQVDELHQLEHLAPLLKPDVVVVGLYEGNDLEDNLDAVARSSRVKEPVRPAEMAELVEPPEPDNLVIPFLRRVGQGRFWAGSSAVFQYVRPALDRLVGRLGIRTPVPQILDESLRISVPSSVADALAETRRALEALASRCAELDADLVVLMIPAAIQAEPARYEEFLAAHPVARRTDYSRTQLHEHLARLAEEAGARVVDPLPRLERAALAARPCYRREGHWNAAGHKLAAELLVPVLADVFTQRGAR
jgi:hypothetical protein